MLWSWNGQIINKFLVEANTKWGGPTLKYKCKEKLLRERGSPHFWERLSVRF